MVAAYSDVVGTLALLIALGGLVFTWWSRRHQPEQEVRVKKAIRRSEEAERLLPQLRSDVLNALQFLDEDPAARPTNTRLNKEAARLRALRGTWNEARRHAVDAELRNAMTALDLPGELEWLESPQPVTDEEEVSRRLVHLGWKLRHVLGILDADALSG